MDLSRTVPAHLEVRLRIADSRSPHGPRIALRASLALPTLLARVIFRHRVPRHGSEREEFMRQVAVVPPGARVERVDDRMRAVPAGNLLVLRLMDHEFEPLTPERVIGECLDGTCELDLPVSVDTIASAWVLPKDGSERPGPALKLCGALTLLRGLVLRVGTRSRREAGESNGELRGIDLPLIRPGLTPHYDEKTFEGGFPLNWWALVAFLDGRGQTVGEEHLIGRFVVI